MGEDGELYVDAFGRFRLRNEPTIDKTKLSAVTAELVANFHDLTVPLSHTQQHNFTRAVTPTANTKQKPLDPINDLLIPRLKAAPSEETPVVDEERVKVMREHGVVWHIRTLPAGWKASPEATNLAKQRSVKLKKGETFVREHTRGKEHPVKGHKIVRRRAGKMALDATGLVISQ